MTHPVKSRSTYRQEQAVDGFWDGMITFIDHATASGFLSARRRGQLRNQFGGVGSEGLIGEPGR